MELAWVSRESRACSVLDEYWLSPSFRPASTRSQPSHTALPARVTHFAFFSFRTLDTVLVP